MDNEIELNLERTLGIWWSFIWRATLAGILGGGFLGFIGGFIVGMYGQPQIASAIGALMGWFAGVIGSIWAIRASLIKKRDGFRIVLIRNN